MVQRTIIKYMRLIKKYKNRRLYDVELKKTITVEELRKYILDDIDLKIVENATGRDISIPVLSGLIGRSAADFREYGWKVTSVIMKKGGIGAMDIFKKLALAGIGVVNMTSEKLEELFDEMVKKGEMTKDERAEAIKTFVDKSVEKSGQVREKAEDLAQKIYEKFSSKFNDQITELAVKIEDLSKKVSELEKKTGGK